MRKKPVLYNTYEKKLAALREEERTNAMKFDQLIHRERKRNGEKEKVAK